MKILIIEDENELADSISEYLSEENYLCEFARTYNQALEKIESFHYDCILLDIMLPDGNGMNILEELKRQDKQDGVIIISAKNALDDKIKGLQIGADDYLTKPFHLSELAARIYSVIRRKQFGNANLVQHCIGKRTAPKLNQPLYAVPSPILFPMWQNPLRSFGYAESGILPHRFGGLHPQMLLVATRTSHICEFAKSQERKQTSFSGLRKSAEPLAVSLKKKTQTQ